MASKTNNTDNNTVGTTLQYTCSSHYEAFGYPVNRSANQVFFNNVTIRCGSDG